jgi:hypothetical protein
LTSRKWVNKNVVHPILAYADLMNTGERRFLETAQKIYDELLTNKILIRLKKHFFLYLIFWKAFSKFGIDYYLIGARSRFYKTVHNHHQKFVQLFLIPS